MRKYKTNKLTLEEAQRLAKLLIEARDTDASVSKIAVALTEAVEHKITFEEARRIANWVLLRYSYLKGGP